MLIRLLISSVPFVACTGTDSAKNTYTGPGPSFVDTAQDTDADSDTDSDSDSDSDSDTDTDSDTDSDADTDTDSGSDPPELPTPDFTTRWGSGMMQVPAGMFTMGSGAADPDDAYTDHEVTLTRDFWAGQSEVTQEQWALFPDAYDSTPSAGDHCPSCPVDQVSWQDAALYANALSGVEGFAPCYLVDGSDVDPAYLADPYSCPGYRLLTEAEWEYAARAGEDTEFSGSNRAADVAWYAENSGDRSHNVGSLWEDAFGLFDMSGNVYEWTNDRVWSGGSDGAPTTDPAGASSGYNRILRGGRWSGDETDIRVVTGFAVYYELQAEGAGFRLCRTVTP